MATRFQGETEILVEYTATQNGIELYSTTGAEDNGVFSFMNLHRHENDDTVVELVSATEGDTPPVTGDNMKMLSVIAVLLAFSAVVVIVVSCLTEKKY